MMPARADRVLAQLALRCLALPESTRTNHGSHVEFRVRKRVFAYFLNNHHGDGIVSLCVRTTLGEGIDRISRDGARFYSPAYIGPRGWVGLRVDVGRISWAEVTGLVISSYRIAAPAALARRLDPPRRR